MGMEYDREALDKIVSERASKIQVEALEQITHIQESRERELARIVPDLLKQIENFPIIKRLDILEVIRNGGVVKTADYAATWDKTRWRLEIGNDDVFYSDHSSSHLAKGRYRVTLIMEKLEEEES